MNIRTLIREIIEEVLDETQGLDFKFISQIDYVITVSINGKRHSFRVNRDPKEFARKLNKMRGFSHGKALTWLKKNSKPLEEKRKSSLEVLKTNKTPLKGTA